MKKDNSTSDKTKGGKKRVVWLASLGAIVVIIFLGFFLPITINDGTEKLTGKEKQAAELQLASAPHLVDAMDRYANMILKYRVESVYETPQDQLDFWCHGDIDKSQTYYSVTIGEYTLFGIKVGEFSRHDTCALMNKQ